MVLTIVHQEKYQRCFINVIIISSFLVICSSYCGSCIICFHTSGMSVVHTSLAGIIVPWTPKPLRVHNPNRLVMVGWVLLVHMGCMTHYLKALVKSDGSVHFL